MANVPPDGRAIRLVDLCATYLRSPSSCATDGTTGDPILTFDPALTAAEQTTYSDLLLMAKFGISANLTLAEFQAIKPDLATARQYVGLSSPTSAQTVAALKSTIRVLGALLRE